MVRGIEIFKEYFKDFQGQYTLIGDVACGLLMDDAGLDFRLTKDFDIVLIVEALSENFGKAFWSFINAGAYEHCEKGSGETEFYRFINPSNLNFPKEIELFSRKGNMLGYSEDARLTPIHISDEISSLSAILLDDEYYKFLLSGLDLIDDIQILKETHIIPFKAKAWLDLSQRKESGQHVDSRNIIKHKNDIYRLSQLLSENIKVILPEIVKNDMQMFLRSIEKEGIILEDIGVEGTTKNEILIVLNKVYLN